MDFLRGLLLVFQSASLKQLALHSWDMLHTGEKNEAPF